MKKNRTNLIAPLLSILLPAATYGSQALRTTKTGGRATQSAARVTTPKLPSQKIKVSPKSANTEKSSISEKTKKSHQPKIMKLHYGEKEKNEEEKSHAQIEHEQKLAEKKQIKKEQQQLQKKALDNVQPDIEAAQEKEMRTIFVSTYAYELIHYIKNLAQQYNKEIIPDTWITIRLFDKDIFTFMELPDGTIKFLETSPENLNPLIINPNKTYWKDFSYMPEIDKITKAPTTSDVTTEMEKLKNKIEEATALAEIEETEQEVYEMEQALEQQKQILQEQAATEKLHAQEEAEKIRILHVKAEEKAIKKAARAEAKRIQEAEKKEKEIRLAAEQKAEAEKLEREEEAAQQKAIEEQAQRAEEKLKKEVDAEYELYEKEAAELARIEQEIVAQEEALRQFKLEQEKIVTSKAEQETLLKEIAKDEASIEQLENKLDKKKLEMEHTKRTIEETNATLEQQLQRETDAQRAQQTIESIQRKKELEKNVQTKKENISLDTQEIERLEAELTEIKNKFAEFKEQIEEVKINFAQQKKEIDTNARIELEHVEQEITSKIQQAQASLEHSQDFINKTTQEQFRELDLSKTRYQQEAIKQQQLIEKAKNDAKQKITANYERDLERLHAELESFQKQQLQPQELGQAQLRLQTEQLQPQELGKAQLEQQNQQLQPQELGQAQFRPQAEQLLPQELGKAQLEQQNQQLQPQELGQAQFKPQAEQLLPQELGKAQLEQQNQQLQPQELGQAQFKPQAEQLLPQELGGAQFMQETVEKEKEKTEKENKREQNSEEKREKEKEAEGGFPETGEYRKYKEESYMAQGERQQLAAKSIHNFTNPVTTVKTPITVEPIQGNQPNPSIKQIVLPQKTSPTKTYNPTIQQSNIQPSIAPVERHQAALNQPTSGSAGTTPSRRPGRPTRRSTYQPPFTPPLYTAASTSYTPSMGAESFPSYTSPYVSRTGSMMPIQPKKEESAAEIERVKKVQPEDVTWWEKLLPNWVVRHLGRKDRTIKEQKKTELEAMPIPTKTEQKEEIGIVKTIIETIKKPISNTIDYIRQWWKSS